MSSNPQAQYDNENIQESIEIALTGGDFTTAADIYESYESHDSIKAKEYFDSLSQADQTQLRVALDKKFND